MTHNFEIKVQCKGVAVGTLNWLNSILADGELVIKNTKAGSAGLFFHEKHDLQGKERKENEGNIFICKPVRIDDEAYSYKYVNIEGIELYRVYAQSNEYQHGFTDYALTPAALAKLEEFLSSAAITFAAWWKAQ